jgi:hypothetical protein
MGIRWFVLAGCMIALVKSITAFRTSSSEKVVSPSIDEKDFDGWKDGLAKHFNADVSGDKLEVLSNGVELSEVPESLNSADNIQINVDSNTNVVYRDTKCPISQDLVAPYPAKLSVCGEFSHSACCSVAEEEKIAYMLRNEYQVVYGSCPGCLDNMRKLLCGIHCSPDIVRVIKPFQNNEIAQVNVCSSFCDSLYASCKDTSFASSYHGDDASSFCIPQLDSLSDIRIKLVPPESEELCLDPQGSWECLPGAETESEPIDTTWMWITGIVLLTLLLLSFLSYRAYRGAKDSAKRLTRIKEMSKFENLPSYLFINGCYIDGNNRSGNGYYVCDKMQQKRHEKEKEEDEDTKLKSVKVDSGKKNMSTIRERKWTWLSPVISNSDDNAVYKRRHEQKMWTILEGVSLPISEGEPPLPGPANGVVVMKEISNLHSTYTAKVEAYVSLLCFVSLSLYSSPQFILE